MCRGRRESEEELETREGGRRKRQWMIYISSRIKQDIRMKGRISSHGREKQREKREIDR